MAIAQVFAGIPVADYEPARAWYERLFGRPPDAIAHATEALWRGEGAGGQLRPARRRRPIRAPRAAPGPAAAA